jgi:hypothetical protein
LLVIFSTYSDDVESTPPEMFHSPEENRILLSVISTNLVKAQERASAAHHQPLPPAHRHPAIHLIPAHVFAPAPAYESTNGTLIFKKICTFKNNFIYFPPLPDFESFHKYENQNIMWTHLKYFANSAKLIIKRKRKYC